MIAATAKRAGTVLVLALAAACGGGHSDDSSGGDLGGTDLGHLPDGAPILDAGGGDMHPAGDGGCVVAQVLVCGDHMDQNCDGHDESCGDQDHDGTMACMTGQDPTTCDCDDTDANTYPSVGSLLGGHETCDGRDNNCNGRVDEAAACCAACTALGDVMRADICNDSGACVCSTEGAGDAPCAVGEQCCSHGCTNTQTDFMNCGFCESQCTVSSDNCAGGNCMCGTATPCDLATVCSGGSC